MLVATENSVPVEGVPVALCLLLEDSRLKPVVTWGYLLKLVISLISSVPLTGAPTIKIDGVSHLGISSQSFCTAECSPSLRFLGLGGITLPFLAIVGLLIFRVV